MHGGGHWPSGKSYWSGLPRVQGEPHTKRAQTKRFIGSSSWEIQENLLRGPLDTEAAQRCHLGCLSVCDCLLHRGALPMQARWPLAAAHSRHPWWALTVQRALLFGDILTSISGKSLTRPESHPIPELISVAMGVSSSDWSACVIRPPLWQGQSCD